MHGRAAVFHVDGDTLAQLLGEAGLEVIRHEAPGETRSSLSVIDRHKGEQFRFMLPGPPWSVMDVIGAERAIVGHARAGGIAVLSGTLLFGAALLRPQISMTGAQWPLMQLPGLGQRYYYLPMLAWLAVLFAAAGSRAWGLRLVGAPLLLLAAFGVYSDWRMPSRAPTGFAEAMRRFEASPPGTTMSFEFHPLFEQMPMRLTKR